MTKKQSGRNGYDRKYLEALIEEATVDCYNEYEQAVGLFTKIGDELDLIFDYHFRILLALTHHTRGHDPGKPVMPPAQSFQEQSATGECLRRVGRPEVPRLNPSRRRRVPTDRCPGSSRRDSRP